MAEPAQHFDIFTKFPELPAEIRLKIWKHACSIPRNIDLWSEFRRKEIENTIFFTQLYDSKLTNISPPPILQVSQESRQEALLHFTMEFHVGQQLTINNILRDIQHPGFYTNVNYDTFIPRGNWNIVSMHDFLARRAPGQVRSLAIDIKSSFYDELYTDYIIKEIGFGPFGLMDDIIFYDATELSVFKKGYNGGKVALDFVDVENPTSDLNRAKDRLVKIFDDMVQKESARKAKIEREQAIQGKARGTIESMPEVEFKKPHVRIMELVVRS